MAIVFAQIEIAASPPAVIALLADTARYPSWNPLLRRVEASGASLPLTIGFHPSGLWPIDIRAELSQMKAPDRLVFVGYWLHPVLFSYHHQIEFDPSEGDCLLRQTLRLTGLLQKIYPDFMMHPVRRALCRMNEAARDLLERPRLSGL